VINALLIMALMVSLCQCKKVVVYFSADSPVLKYKELLSATLFSFLSDMNSSLCCVAVDCVLALVDLTGLMSEKEASVLCFR